MMLIESGGALFKANRYEWPLELWNVQRQRWEPYKGSVPKEIGWGDVVTADEAAAFKASI